MTTRITILDDKNDVEHSTEAAQPPVVNHAGCPPFEMSDSFDSLDEQLQELDEIVINRDSTTSEYQPDRTSAPETNLSTIQGFTVPSSPSRDEAGNDYEQTDQSNGLQQINIQEEVEQSSVIGSLDEQATQFVDNTTAKAVTAKMIWAGGHWGSTGMVDDEKAKDRRPPTKPITNKAVIVGIDETKAGDDEFDVITSCLQDFGFLWAMNQRMTLEELKTVFTKDLEIEELTNQLKELGHDIVELEFDVECLAIMPQLMAAHAEHIKATLNTEYEPPPGATLQDESSMDGISTALVPIEPTSCNEQAIVAASNVWGSYDKGTERPPCSYDSFEMSLGACAPTFIPGEPVTIPGLPAQQKEFLQWLVQSQGLGFECVTPPTAQDGPAVLRVMLSDGTMASVSQDAADKLDQCHWV